MVRLTALLLTGELLSAGCGAANGNGSSRFLQSVSVTPAVAEARNFPNGQVQFTAMGTYSQPPSPTPINQPNWSLSAANIATITQSGLAQCDPNASGVVTVRASTAAPCSGTGCTPAELSGTAQLTCP